MPNFSIAARKARGINSVLACKTTSPDFALVPPRPFHGRWCGSNRKHGWLPIRFRGRAYFGNGRCHGVMLRLHSGDKEGQPTQESPAMLTWSNILRIASPYFAVCADPDCNPCGDHAMSGSTQRYRQQTIKSTQSNLTTTRPRLSTFSRIKICLSTPNTMILTSL